MPPLTPQRAAARWRATCGRPRISPRARTTPGFEGTGAYDDPERRPLGERCLMGFGSTSGPPALPNYFYNNLHQIVQTPDSVMILTEMVHDARDRPDERASTCRRRSASGWAIRSATGKATRWWSTPRISPTRRGSAARRQNLHIVERFTRVDAKTLLYRFTIEDPDDVDAAVDRRVHVAGDRRADVRIRVPRRQLRAGQHPARRAAEGSGRRRRKSNRSSEVPVMRD